MEQYRATINIITPLIIHNGTIYDVWDIVPNPKNNEVFIIDVARAFMLMRENEKENFNTLLDKIVKTNNGNDIKVLMTKLNGMLHNKVFEEPDIIIRKAKALEGFVKQISDNPNLQINKIFTDKLTNKPFIPGSSVKGMLRTAMLESLRKKFKLEPMVARENVRKGKVAIKNALDFEASIYGSPENKHKVNLDPFRFLKVSDFTLQNAEIIFGTVRNIGYQSKQKGIPIYTEMTGCELFEKKEFVAAGDITIDSNQLKKFLEKNNFRNSEQVLHMFSASYILGALKDFYNQQLNNKKHPVSQDIVKCIQKYAVDNYVPIRLGRFSQVESKTFKIIRTWDKGQNRSMNIEGGASRNYIKETIGAGWGALALKKA